ncbi:hypothetical protein [Paenibacillus sp. MMS20-IR301]|uniref:hypothetical protein n=1 Tax=Paenibacillus sp. MMS20-IR301 TaxID=2895946 RepID=UPI0028E6F7F3|nr:hypothetical protein [Paenibacillus sp. MMS20-IR301]WNS42039.1 hypothetical protein LOS79_23950 [Paenibacillus sp. MMS20-IR301]
MTDKVNEKYRKAIEDLRQINDDLFYEDLKNKLNDHVDRLELSYETSKKGIEAMNGTIRQVPIDIDLKMEELHKAFTQHSFQTLDDMKKELRESHQQSLVDLHGVIDVFVQLQNNFVAIQDNLSYLNQEQVKQWDELNRRLMDRFEQLEAQMAAQGEAAADIREGAAVQLSVAKEQHMELLVALKEERRRNVLTRNFMFGLLVAIIAAEAIRFVIGG